MNGNNTLATPALIICKVCELYGVSEDDIIGSSKSKKAREARGVAMYLIRHLLHETIVNVGKFFNRDHATVCYAIKTIEHRLNQPGDSLAQTMQRVTSTLTGESC